MTQVNYDYDILMSFVPGGDKGRFLAFESVYSSSDGSLIYAPYRAPFSSELVIYKTEYESRLKQKQREEKLNQLVP